MRVLPVCFTEYKNYRAEQSMGRLLSIFAAIWVATFSLSYAQDFSALARIIPEKTSVSGSASSLELRLGLSQPVPFRVFTLSNPNRVVVDFREVDFTRLDANSIAASDAVSSVRSGGFQRGWSRLVLELAVPLVVQEAGMETGQGDGEAVVRLQMARVDQSAFDAEAGARANAAFPDTVVTRAPVVEASDRIHVMLDPGHGGIDPGAVRDEIHEANLMLSFARELQDVLRRSGRYDVSLTRTGDYFVSLEARIALARTAGADVMISLHADAVATGVARGAQVFTLSDDATSEATALLAERHARDQMLSGVDLSDQDDGVARALMSIARTETEPRTEALADALVAGLRDGGIALHKRPREKGAFSVLKAPDLPAVLLEVGFMSSPKELEKLKNPEWRGRVAVSILNALDTWQDKDAALRALRRQ
jgi:N-acetylmuramoyl-L-alanine amidase